ncbi:MAG: porphobilinogen synthase [Proteobacteria bacterium]|nr:porphobilinogen synthase [Pseudomonadota bacterium]
MENVFYGGFPQVRLRRLRRTAYLRDLVCEHTLRAHDLIWPIFIKDHSSHYHEITSMPGVYHCGLKELLNACEQACQLGIRAIALFPVISPEKKCLMAREAYYPDSLVPRFVAQIKQRFPDLCVIGDVALDPYTSHGHDGLLAENGAVLNDDTVRVLCEQASVLAGAGVDVVAPSDMMDGRVAAIRQSLDQKGFTHTIIMSYAAKYASSLYQPFRVAIGSSLGVNSQTKKTHHQASKNPLPLCKKTYQLSPDRLQEALREVAFDLKEGADLVLIKPATLYADIIKTVSQTFHVPTFAYHVSGEYAMIKAGVARGVFIERDVVSEILLSLKRAGAQGIFTYYAPVVAGWLQDGHER